MQPGFGQFNLPTGSGSKPDQGTPLRLQPIQKLLAERLFRGLQWIVIAGFDLLVLGAPQIIQDPRIADGTHRSTGPPDCPACNTWRRRASPEQIQPAYADECSA